MTSYNCYNSIKIDILWAGNIQILITCINLMRCFVSSLNEKYFQHFLRVRFFNMINFLQLLSFGQCAKGNFLKGFNEN